MDEQIVSKNLCFLWHMHQPDYQDKSGMLQMPWVFLHSIKDYYEMPWLLSKFSILKATFNITSTLIKQIKIYEKYGYQKDKFLILWMKNTNSISKEEKKYLIKICKSAQYNTMVKKIYRFKQLYDMSEYNENELRDLEVVFILSWCGNYLQENNVVVQKMMQKGRDFTQEDKKELLNSLISFIPKILPFYKKLLKNKQISISTTPYNHPILPLLFDMENAKLSNPNTVLPKEYFSLKDDAIKQVDLAIEQYEEVFEEKPSGLWPAEGGVDKKSLDFYKSRNIKWVATDEAILYKSLKENDNNLKYKLYDFNDVFIAFRDHFLSDLIGFTYRYKDAKDATDDFIKKIETTQEESNIFVILDGENAWEFYQNNAKDFFINLYNRLIKDKNIQTKTMDEINKNKKEKLQNLTPGSWIYGDFNTWVGDDEKNAAWELLYQTKRDFKRCKITNQEILKKIDEHFLAAECSDWFWWYGEDHFSDFLNEFDILFKAHLINIYKLCNMPIPSILMIPIQKERKAKLSLVEPKCNINVKIDGKKSSFYEWLGCGMVDENRIFSTMDSDRGAVRKLYYGENRKYLFLRLDGNIKKMLNDFLEFKIHLKELKKIVVIPVKSEFKNKLINMSIKDFVEIRIDKKICQKIKKINLQIELIDKNNNSEFIPIFGDIQICGNEYEKNWFI